MKYVDCLLRLYLSKSQKQLVHTEQTNRKKEWFVDLCPHFFLILKKETNFYNDD